MINEMTIEAALHRFAESVKAKMSTLTPGAPEDQLRAPFETFMSEAASALGWSVVCTGETTLANRIGRPDYAVHLNKLLAGYAELKAPGTGADPGRFSGRNRKQWGRFQLLPNLLYSDGNEWGLARNGEMVDRVVRLSGDITTEGKKAVLPEDAFAIECILREFLAWQPIIPTDRRGKVDLKGFAGVLAPLCRMLRADVAEALESPDSPLNQLAKDWRQLLFPDASDEQFADAYAQTVTFAVLLGRSEGAEPLTLGTAQVALAVQHTLLSRALQVLTDPGARAEISASLDLLLRVIGAVPTGALAGPEDPWLYFYEDFLASYDPKLRKDAGAYYTPVQVVRAQVRLVDELLINRLGRPLGFADLGVITLDPAVGTGTYLLGVIEHALSRIEVDQGAGAVPGQASTLATNLYGFEVMVGPYAVSELRISRALRDRGATLPAGGSQVYLTDTLESPNAKPPQLPLFLKPIADQHARALNVKSAVPVIVCVGNPPYDRHEAATAGNKARAGGWVRWGDDGKGTTAILRDFVDPAIAAGHGGAVKNIYNLYVYFWRWALWKVFEHESSRGPGVVSFISAASYLDGDAFSGMREHMRRVCDEIWILDIGGEGRGTRQSENVFAIQTPVAIAVAVRAGKATKKKEPAPAHYSRIDGSREAKLAALNAIVGFSSVEWQDCPTDWQAPFRPAGKGRYFDWPLLVDLMPWQHSGAQVKRTWPICPDPGTLGERWKALLRSADLATAFKETRDRVVSRAYAPLFEGEKRKKSLSELSRTAPCPEVKRYAYRSFDRQWILADSRLGDFLRPDLWRAHSERQIYVTSLFSQPLGNGPALTAAAFIPDLDYFRGSYGAKAAIPLYRDSGATEPNIVGGLLDLLRNAYGRAVTPEDLLSYVYGVLAQPAFTARYSKELEARELRVPIPKDAELFERVRRVGAGLLWLHTYGARLVPTGKRADHIPSGSARCTKPIPEDRESYPDSFKYGEATRTLRIGAGELHPVSPEVFEFEVSGLKVVQSWLSYRMKKGSGKKSSPLDNIRPERWTSEFTTELLQLLWVLEATVQGYGEQQDLLDAVVAAPCFAAAELPAPTDGERRPPDEPSRAEGLFSQ